MADMDNNFITLKEAGKLLGVKWQIVRNYIKEGKLNAVKLNGDGNYGIYPKDLRQFILNSSISNDSSELVVSSAQDSTMKSMKNCYLYYDNKKSVDKIFNDIHKVNFKCFLRSNLLDDNSIYIGDNLLVLGNLLPKYRGKVDLIYIDPPFGTNQHFITYNSKTAYSDKVTDEEFLEFLRCRLYLLREFLSDRGSIYLHIDKKMSHYVKIIMDEVFKQDNFINEITRVKCNPKNFSRKAYGNITDTILFYSKIRDNNIWNDVTVPLSENEIARLFPKIDNEGRRYTTNPLHAPGETKDGPTGGMWHGMYPPHGRHWRYNPSVLTELDDCGLIEWSSTGNPRKIIYASEHNGKKVQDIWLNYKDKGSIYTKYPTQKNDQMLQLIIKMSSNPGSLVLDAFMGSGSTLINAYKLGRRFIGIDSSELSCKVACTYFQEHNIPFNAYSIDE